MHGSVARCLECFVNWLLRVEGERGLSKRGSGLHPVAPEAMALASALIHGSAARRGNCCCCLASASFRGDGAPVLALSAAGSSLRFGHLEGVAQPAARIIYNLLDLLVGLQSDMCVQYMIAQKGGQVSGGSSAEQLAADLRLLAIKGGHLLLLQHAALWLARERQRRAAGGGGPQAGSRRRVARGSGGSTSSGAGSGAGAADPACADLAAFLGPADGGGPAAMLAAWQEEEQEEQQGASPSEALELQMQVIRMILMHLDRVNREDSACLCRRCTAQQLLLVVETVAGQPFRDAAQLDKLGSTLGLMGGLLQLPAFAAFAAGFMRAATPSLSAWALAAAHQLRTASGAGAAATSPSGGSWQLGLSGAVLHASAMLMLQPGGLLHPADPCEPAVAGQLLTCAELALRTPPPALMQRPGAAEFAAFTVVLSAVEDTVRMSTTMNMLEVGWRWGSLLAVERG